MEIGLYQEQTQKLVMTMQMKQAIQMLQCTMEELNDYLVQEFNENPLLQFKPASALQELSYPARVRTKRGQYQTTAKSLPFEQFVRGVQTMQDQLAEQVALQNQPKHILEIARELIGCMDESGYVVGSDEELLAVCHCDNSSLEQAITTLQQCEPVGIGARSLKECLMLQANQLQNPLRDKALSIIQHRLPDIAASKLHHIARDFNMTIQEVQEIVDCIRRMNPRPGASLGDNDAHYVVPEVFVRREGSTFRVYTNADAQPQVRIDKTYEAILRQQQEPEAKKFLQQKLQGVHWLRRSLEQRKMTLVRVAEAIVSVQHRFFIDGPAGLQPLTLKQVADAVELHESTVSRTVRGKYMDTPAGVFELKYFFTSELQSSSGSVSAHSVKHLIQTWVDGEDTLHPLSDEALSKQLLQHGIRVSRRTVAKYRDELRIPASSKRRRFA